MRCEKGAIDENLAAIQRAIEAADTRAVDVIVFPEASITGYVNPRRYPRAAVSLDGPEVARFVAATRGSGLTALAGVIEANPRGLPFITHVIASEGRLVGHYRKRTIATDERELFAAGSAPGLFEHRGTKRGVAICADIDHESVFAECAAAGAQVVFEAAAPGLYGERATRDWAAGYEWWRGECRAKAGAYAAAHGLWICVATQAGRTSDEDFPGGGYVFAPDGTCVAESGDWAEGVLYADIAVEPTATA
jgi:predicted amidohydrolase